jgi:predicted CXXCH cytochrome family protein
MNLLNGVKLMLAACIALPLASLAQDFSNLMDSRHDLAVYLPPPTSDREDDTRCVFCHLPRGRALARGVWTEDQPDSLLIYPYERPDIVQVTGKPDGSTLICLSCHDGTIAFGDNLTNRAQSSATSRDSPQSAIPGGHPVSLAYQPAPANGGNGIRDRKELPEQVAIDAAGKMQCVSCHDPHDDSNGNFLVMEDRASALCVTCHIMSNWESSVHATSAATWNSQGRRPWPARAAWDAVREHGCANCHAPHAAGDGRSLLYSNSEEENCLSCHNGNVAQTDISTEFRKASRHPIDMTTGVHRANEDVLISPADRHVECVDCHDPHTTRASMDGSEFTLARDVAGIDVNGAPINDVIDEYEMCFRCHGDGPAPRAMPTPRLHEQTNVRLQFDSGNPSFHPVVAPGNNPDVPSLIAPLAENATIRCSACHSNDAGSRSGGQGPDGPHGSIFPSLLSRNYQTRDRTPESPNAYALCYSCHDRNSILADESFAGHRLHVSDNNTPCSACHDPHGISLTQGTTENNSHLINFDTSIVFRNTEDEIRFEDRGNRAGACYLSCHNTNHDGWSYE